MREGARWRVHSMQTFNRDAMHNAVYRIGTRASIIIVGKQEPIAARHFRAERGAKGTGNAPPVTPKRTPRTTSSLHNDSIRKMVTSGHTFNGDGIIYQNTAITQQSSFNLGFCDLAIARWPLPRVVLSAVESSHVRIVSKINKKTKGR